MLHGGGEPMFVRIIIKFMSKIVLDGYAAVLNCSKIYETEEDFQWKQLCTGNGLRERKTCANSKSGPRRTHQLKDVCADVFDLTEAVCGEFQSWNDYPHAIHDLLHIHIKVITKHTRAAG